ncbi:MAG: hypothetical protein JO061_11210, partial [Acidobacteriaceae bacterium]|nr:hypothetical protein [Acidobacteriaceae bacterium]
MNSAVRSPILFLAVALALPLRAQTEAGFAPSESAGLAQTADVHSVVPDLLQQQKQIWTFPARAVKGKHLVPVLAVLGVTGALIATDSQSAAYFRGNKTYSSFNNAFSSTATAAAIVAVPAAFYGYGFLTHDTTAKSTAWLAGEALVGSELLGYVMKTIDQRRTPG